MTKKNKKEISNVEATYDDESAIDKLADAVADYWQEGTSSSHEDPFDIYIQAQLTKISSDRHAFRGRLRRGYRSLIENTLSNP